MKKDYVVLYNSKANNGHGEETARKLDQILKTNDIEYVDVIQTKDYKSLFEMYNDDQKFLICGGDGTLNHFVNDLNEDEIPNEIYYYPSGTGNDFWNDLGLKVGDYPINVKKYLVNLPTVEINGKVQKFINGVGYGIDGYCCEVGDKLKATSTKEINYAGIAVKGLLFHFKPANAVITVDGKRYEYKKVWLAPMMHGRFYGGGMIPTPQQDRLNNDGALSCLVWHGSGKLATLMNFPKIFKGEHLKKQKMCTVLTGKKITVEFDKPIAAQIDGETVLNVTKCEACGYSK